MRYLKKFVLIKESVDNLQEFCEMNLATLLDNGYSVNIMTESYMDFNCIVIDNIEGNNFHLRGFEWDDVKDYVIPFISVLQDSYDVTTWGGVNNNLVKFIYINDGQDIKYCGEDQLDSLQLLDIKSIVLKVRK